MVPQWLRRSVAAPRGFTMAEMVVVIAILAILAAVSVPSLWAYVRTAALRAGAEELVAVLNGARQLAIRLNTKHTRTRHKICYCESCIHAPVGVETP